MATIGAFHKQADGSYTGTIKTLTLDLKQVQLRPSGKVSGNTPDYRIFIGQTELGAAWKKTGRDERPYLTVKLDDPSFPAPVYANLVEAEDGHSLVWSRSRTTD